MNLDRLKEAEATFLQIYPGGFADPAIQPIRRKHNVDRLIRFTGARLARPAFNRPRFVADTVLAVVGRSSMVSRFEKPPFRSFIESLSSDGKKALARALEQRLFGRRQHGFEAMVEMLSRHGVAKWTVVSAVPFYFAPRREVFVKPTTAKRILRALEIADLRYQAAPTWAFYAGFRRLIAEVRAEVSPSLAPNNAALTGFLMMAL